MFFRFGRPVRHRALGALVGVVVLVASTLTGCGLLGPESAGAPTSGASGLTKLVIGGVNTVDLAPLYWAIQQGYFAEKRLEVELKTVANGSEAVEGLETGKYHLVYASYVPFILAHIKLGQGDPSQRLQFVAENTYGKERAAMLVLPPGRDVNNLKELERKRIAVPGVRTSADLLVMSALEANQVDYRTVQFIPVKFPDMANALATGQVDAAMMVEPWITQAATERGAIPRLDLATGPTLELPFTGFGAKEAVASEHPELMRAFRDVLARSSDEIALNRGHVEAVLPDFAKIPPKIASLIALPGFRATLAKVGIQRVADLMTRFGFLPNCFDVGEMLFEPEPTIIVGTTPPTPTPSPGECAS
jgi:NitT/TauT family transport system substrate-binding protein